ncbi:MAG TPA: TIGR03564 family F420-dependent LLM class oxidoreductase [Acidimicrobiales bacterium]
MKIGLTAAAATLDKTIAQAEQAEADGFHSLWYASGLLGDPLVAIALAGRATSTIELGTAVLQTYPCHPLLQARRAASVVEAMGRPGFTLGVGPSHDAVVEGTYGLAFDHPGRSSEEYVQILTTLLRGEGIEFEGEDWTVRAPEGSVRAVHPVPVLLSALSPRLLRVAGEHADGTVLWMAPRAAIESHVAPRITEAATAAGRPAPRIVAGLPVAVDDDLDAAREAVAATAAGYESRPIYKRIMAVGGADSAAEAAIVGDEASVEAQVRSLFDAGATDLSAFIVPVGPDRRASVGRTTELLSNLARE